MSNQSYSYDSNGNNTALGISPDYVYSSFGRLLAIDGGSGPMYPKFHPHLYGYTGRESDSDLAFAFRDRWMYYRARYDNPSTGRFVSPDHISFAAGDTNLNRCVGNLVNSARDLSGLWKDDVF